MELEVDRGPIPRPNKKSVAYQISPVIFFFPGGGEVCLNLKLSMSKK